MNLANQESLKRWIKRYESDGVENMSDRDRKELLKAALENDKQRVWVARHICSVIADVDWGGVLGRVSAGIFAQPGVELP